MNALNEVNKVIASVTYYPHRHTGLEEEEWLTAERMAVSNTALLSPRQSFGGSSLQRRGFISTGTGFFPSVVGFPFQLSFHQCILPISRHELVQ
jgi:hypothetical protein